MTIVDNFDEVRKHLVFNNPEEFYFAQVVKRAKDHPEMTRYMLVLKSYYIFSLADFDRYKEDIIKLCREHNGRACIDFNKLNIHEVKDKTKDLLDKYASYGPNWYRKLHWCFDSASVVVSTSRENNYMTVDVDQKGIVDEVKEYLGDKVMFNVPTVAGDHIIIKQYKDRRPFFEHFSNYNIDIMEYCYVFLYAYVEDKV